MREFIRSHSMMIASFLFGVWIYFVWKLTGMPSPGFLGRLIPFAWVAAGLLSGKSRTSTWFIPVVVFFTISSWIWMVFEPGWLIAGASAAAGIILWGIYISGKSRSGLAAALIPAVIMVLFTADVNSDEVRFAEISAAVTGISSESYGERQFRTGDISLDTGHHTAVYPAIISPGLLIGDRGLRAVPLLITFAAVLLLGKLAGPAPAAAAALLYPGFGTLGLAMTGWLAAGLFSLWMLLSMKGRYGPLRILIVILLVAIKMRYAGLAAGMIIVEYACMKKLRGKWAIPASILAGTILFLAADKYVLGGELFWARYGNSEMLKLIWINLFHRPADTLSNAGWSLLDPEAGLFFRAPWTIAALYGMGKLAVRSPGLYRKALIPSLSYWVVFIVWSGTSWHGLPAPAGRVFVPLVPMLALGIREVWSRRETRLLILLSVIFSAVVSVYPHARANYADGTDTVLALVKTVSGFSMVRSSGLYIVLALIPPAAVLLIMGRKKLSYGLMALVIFAAALAAGLQGPVGDAEDLTGKNVQGALLYPMDPDPVIRYFWFGSRERMLSMSCEGQSICFQGASPGDTLFIEAASSGGSLVVQGDTIEIFTGQIEIPSEYMAMGRRQEDMQDVPENMLMHIYRIPLSASTDNVMVVHGGGEPVYIDRIGVL